MVQKEVLCMRCQTTWCGLVPDGSHEIKQKLATCSKARRSFASALRVLRSAFLRCSSARLACARARRSLRASSSCTYISSPCSRTPSLPAALQIWKHRLLKHISYVPQYLVCNQGLRDCSGTWWAAAASSAALVVSSASWQASPLMLRSCWSPFASAATSASSSALARCTRGAAHS